MLFSKATCCIVDDTASVGSGTFSPTMAGIVTIRVKLWLYDPPAKHNDGNSTWVKITKIVNNLFISCTPFSTKKAHCVTAKGSWLTKTG